MTRRWPKLLAEVTIALGLLGALVYLAVQLVEFGRRSAGPPTPVVIQHPAPQASRTEKPPSPGALISFAEPKKGQKCDVGKRMEARGAYRNLSPDDCVWLVLRDRQGLYYLQNPPVSLRPDGPEDSYGSWSMRNVVPGENISEICAVLVTQEGEAQFQERVATAVKTNQWSNFARLPSGSRIIGSQPIQTTR